MPSRSPSDVRGERRTSRPTAIDLFSGCGGLTVGLKQAGFSVVAAVEVDAKAQATYRLNHPDVAMYDRDIRKLAASRVGRELSLQRGQLALLAGCPPCQGFSRLRTRNGVAAVSDDRNDLIFEFLRFARALLPKTLMMENVPSLADDVRFEKLCASLKALGYDLEFDVLDASDYAVPQRRKRLILLGSRIHAPQLAASTKRRATVRDAIGYLPHPKRSRDPLHRAIGSRTERVMAIIRNVPRDGGSRSDLPAALQLECHKRASGFYDVYGRMKWSDVSPTITSGCANPSKGRFLHPVQHREISLREAALLQGFPRRYRFDLNHGREAIALMIGNALPPPFIKAHAAGLRDAALR